MNNKSNGKSRTRTFRVGLIGYRFMGKAHSNAWRQAPRFFNLKANVELHTICGRHAASVQAARAQRSAGKMLLWTGERSLSRR